MPDDDRTMTVSMLYYISGGRHDGRDWPQPDHPIEVPEWEGFDLLRGGHAVRVQPRGPGGNQQLPGMPPGTAAAVTPEHAPDPVALAGAAQDEADLAAAHAQAASHEAAAAAEAAEPGTPDADPGQAGEADGLPGEPAGTAAELPLAAAEQPAAAPGPSAPKQAWIDYAVSQGADVHEASAMTKADLMSRYGGRL